MLFRGSIPGIVCFIYGLAKAPGFDPGCAGNVESAHSGEKIGEPFSCDPLNGVRNTITWVF